MAAFKVNNRCIVACRVQRGVYLIIATLSSSEGGKDSRSICLQHLTQG